MSSYFRPSLVDFASMMRRVRGSNLVPAEVIPLPAGWSFVEENSQLQLALGRQAIPKFKQLYDLIMVFSVIFDFAYNTFFSVVLFLTLDPPALSARFRNPRRWKIPPRLFSSNRCEAGV